MMKENVPRRRRKNKGRRYKIINKKTITLFLIVFLIYAILSSSIFCLNKIKITGTKQISNLEILRNISIKPRKNIFLVRTGKIENKLSKHPKIKSIKVNKKYPDILEINIKERKPILTIKTKEKFVLVDSEGYITETSNSCPLYIPVVEGLALLETTPGKNVLSRRIEICKKILENENKILPHKIMKFYFEDDKITFITSYQLKVKLGRTNNVKDAQEKMDGLVSALKGAEKKGMLLDYVEIISKNSIVVGPKKI